MAVERGYEAQVNPPSAPAPVQVSPDAMGAGIGRALEQIGAQAHQNELRAYEIDKQLRANQAQSQWAVNFANKTADISGQIADLEKNPEVGGAGHVQAVQGVLDQVKPLIENISDPGTRRIAEVQAAQQRAQILGRAQIFEVVHSAKAIGDNVATARNTFFNMLASGDGSDDAFAQANAQAGAMLGGLQIGGEQRAALMREFGASNVIGQATALSKNNVAALGEKIKSGEWNGLLTAEQWVQVNQLYTVGLHAEQQKVRQESALLNDQAAMWEEQSRQGIALPEVDVRAAISQFQAMGDKSKALKLDGMLAENRYAKVWTAMTPIQRQQNVAALAGLAKPSAEQQRELAWAQGHIGALDSAFNADPVAYAAQHPEAGAVPPAVDFANPDSLSQRVQWRRAYEQASGRAIPLLSKAEVAPLQEQVHRGTNERQQVLSSLDGFPDTERAIAAEQIMPGDAGFRQEAQLRPLDRATVFNGRAKLKADPRFLAPDVKTDTGKRAHELLGIGGREMDIALRGLPPADVDAIKQSAGQWLAGKFNAQGRDIGSLTPADIRDAALVALGGRMERGRQIGGIAHWHGDRVFVLPDTMSELDFVNAVERDRVFKTQRGEGPTMQLRNAHPVFIGGTRYRWETYDQRTGRGRIVTDAKGRDYISDVTVR